MKKKKTMFLIIAIVIIVIILLLNIFNGNEKKENKLLKIYENLNVSQSYLFDMQQNDENKLIIGKKDDKTIIDQYSQDGHTTTLVKNDNTYFVLHDREEYYIYEQNNVEQSILTDGLKDIVEKEYTTGEEKVLGKKYYYEEYNCSTMFIIANTINSNQEDIKTRFYFDKDNNLVYIKTIFTNKQELLKINLKHEIDDSIFEIPSNYAEN